MKIAVVGAGISGLAAAWLLEKQHDVTLYEAGDYVGGHTHTVDVAVEGQQFPVDTGFLVFNQRTYPNLTALLRILKVETVASDMSFAVSLADPALEWAGSSLATLFAQKGNLARPGFWRMLQDTLRFNRNTRGGLPEITLGNYLAQQGYSAEFRDWYLLPMAAAIWSCPPQSMLDYPLTTFVRFCRNHGLLQVFDRPQWLTVKGGGRSYVARMLQQIGAVKLATPVQSVVRDADGVCLELPGGEHQRYDEVALACHSDEALALLGNAASAAERRLLGAIRYQPNRAVLHTDASLLPRDRRVWSAWNYMAGTQQSQQASVSVSYLINQLQPLPVSTPVIVTLNPHREPDPAMVLGEFDYAHPLFDQQAIAAQAELEKIQGVERVWFCGAWGGYGFHEDGLVSGMAVANRLGCRAPWQAAHAERGSVA
jgi:predicted NAD/FAD-binding protein